jgi:hypothetical protein
MHHVLRFLGAARHRCGARRDAAVDNAGENGAALSKERGSRCRAEGHGEEQLGHQRFIPVFLCSSSESTAFAAALRGPKAGDSPVQKAARAVDKRANNRWTTSRKSVDGAGHKRWIN